MFQANRGGHAPGHIRELFTSAFDMPVAGGQLDPWWEAFQELGGGFFSNEKFQAEWDSWDAEQRAKWVTGQLWNCTDVVPSDFCSALGWEGTRSYAAIARSLRADLN